MSTVKIFIAVFDDEVSTKTSETKTSETKTDPPKAMTQEQHDSIIAGLREEQEAKDAAHQADLETYQQVKGLGDEERATLSAKIKTLENRNLTAEQLSAKERKELQTAAEEKEQNLVIERDNWKSKYEKQTIRTSLLTAGSQKDTEVHNGQQIIDILDNRTRLEPILDNDDKPTGAFDVFVTLDSTDADGKATSLDLRPNEALKQMKTMPQYANLFKNTKLSGVGGHNDKNAKGKNISDMSTKEYMELRNKGASITELTEG